MFEPPRLIGDRLSQPRVRVAVDVHPPRRDAVEQLAAVFGVEVHALASDNRKRRRRRFHLRVRMPDELTIAVEHTHRSNSVSARSRSSSAAHADSASGDSVSKSGISPSTRTPPYCSIARRLSALRGPT